MLNCILLLDSATRFGLKQGNFKCACDAKKRLFLVSLSSIHTLASESSMSPIGDSSCMSGMEV